MFLKWQYLISPKKFLYFSNRIHAWLIVFFGIALSYGLIGGLWLAPSDAVQGEGFRIIYVHVPCAFLSLFIYTVMTFAAILGIVLRLKLAFLVMQQSVSIGAVFAFLALLTGSLWGKPMWGTWWMWDARLTAELVLLFLYIGILLFQSAILEKPNGERLVAVLVLVGSIDLPIIHYSVIWWNTLHQGATLRLFSPPLIAPAMLHPLLAMIVAMMLYYVIILLTRLRGILQ